jgi:hypothetical protein
MVRGFPVAHMILHRTALENDLVINELTTGANTGCLRKIRKELRLELRAKTDLSWAEINKLTGRKKANRRA